MGYFCLFIGNLFLSRIKKYNEKNEKKIEWKLEFGSVKGKRFFGNSEENEGKLCLDFGDVEYPQEQCLFKI